MNRRHSGRCCTKGTDQAEFSTMDRDRKGPMVDVLPPSRVKLRRPAADRPNLDLVSCISTPNPLED